MNSLENKYSGNISFSEIRMYLDNSRIHHLWRLYMEGKEGGAIAPPTRAMNFGKIMHIAILEHDKFEKSKEDFLKQLQPKERETLLYMKNSIDNYPIFKELKNNKESKFEEKIVDEEEKLTCRLDIYSDKNLFELKSIQSLKKINYAVKDGRIDMQMSLQKHLVQKTGREVDNCFVIFIEKCFPWETATILLSENLLSIGRHGLEDRGIKGWEEVVKEIRSDNRKLTDWEEPVLMSDFFTMIRNEEVE